MLIHDVGVNFGGRKCFISTETRKARNSVAKNYCLKSLWGGGGGGGMATNFGGDRQLLSHKPSRFLLQKFPATIHVSICTLCSTIILPFIF